MKLHRTKRVEFAPLIFFPLLNVALLLVAFVVLSSSFVLQPGLSINLPSSSFFLSPFQKAHFISITGGGLSRIYIDDRLTSLKQLGAELDKRNPLEATVIIRADASARHDTVFSVAEQALKRGFSVAIAAGLEQ